MNLGYVVALVLLTSPVTCSGGDGTCENPANARGGLCWGHYDRLRNGSKLPLAAPLKERAETAMEGVLRAARAYRDELDTATDEEHHLGLERLRQALRRRDWENLPKVVRRWPWSPSGREELEKFLATYGDRTKHAQPKRKHHRHLPFPPTKFGPRGTR